MRLRLVELRRESGSTIVVNPDAVTLLEGDEDGRPVTLVWLIDNEEPEYVFGRVREVAALLAGKVTRIRVSEHLVGEEV